MKELRLKVIDSTISPGKLSLRTAEGESIKAALAAAGFQAGDIVSLQPAHPFPLDARVQTAKKLDGRDYTLEARRHRRDGAYGVVSHYVVDRYGACVAVKHDEGGIGHYDFDELMLA